MASFKTASVFHKKEGGDVMAEIYNSIAFLQTTYCFPPESEFYHITNLISPDLSYVEFLIDCHDIESYNKWFELFGEIVEELVIEFTKDLEEKGVTYQRYLPAESPIQPTDALPLESFVSKFDLDENTNEYVFKDQS